MKLAILLVLVIPAAFLLAFVAVAGWRSRRMGDETPGWKRVRPRLWGAYRIAPDDRPVQFRSGSQHRRQGTGHHVEE